MKRGFDQKTPAVPRALSRREMEEQRKKREEEAAAHVFKEFVETFQQAPSTTSKVWVKAGTYDAGARREDTSERGKLYMPTSRLEVGGGGGGGTQRGVTSPSPRTKPSKTAAKCDKKKSNLELFKEELRQMQEERNERHKYKSAVRGALEPDELEPGSYDTGDPNTTNLYLGNLNPKLTERQLMEMFGRYGPLASIKIMWPRSDEEKARGRNCGFVAFMARKDGERALRCINGREVLGYEMKLGWGKAVVIPPVPYYVPPALQQPARPPPPSGLPFNAQPPPALVGRVPRVPPGESLPTETAARARYERVLRQSVVRVVPPPERALLSLIHRTVEFVIREGPMFEAVIMNREMHNPFFRFLFENRSAPHVYYRWRLFSMLQGDSPKQWSTREFRMFAGGSVWRPPPVSQYTDGMPDELVAALEPEAPRGELSDGQRARLQSLLRRVTPARSSVGEVMSWVVEHAEAAPELATWLCDSLTGARTAPAQRVARLYLVSDVLHNAQAKLPHASELRAALQPRLPAVLRACRAARRRLAARSRLQAEGFRARVQRVLHAWSDWAVYPDDFLDHLNRVFHARDKPVTNQGEDGPEVVSTEEIHNWMKGIKLCFNEDESAGESAEGDVRTELPGSPASSGSGSWDGALDGAALRRLAAGRSPDCVDRDAPPATPRGLSPGEDIDGEPLDGEPRTLSHPAPTPPGAFVPSRWEEVEQPARSPTPPASSTTPAPPGPAPPSPPQSAISAASPSPPPRGVPRSTLRDIEVRVLRYADELEAGVRAVREGLTQAQQLQHYRRKLLRKAARATPPSGSPTRSPKRARTDSSPPPSPPPPPPPLPPPPISRRRDRRSPPHHHRSKHKHTKHKY